MDTTAPLTLSAALDALHAQKTTAQQLAETCSRQIERLNPELNAFITVLDVPSALGKGLLVTAHAPAGALIPYRGVRG